MGEKEGIGSTSFSLNYPNIIASLPPLFKKGPGVEHSIPLDHKR